jgi:hypothetical protein
LSFQRGLATTALRHRYQCAIRIDCDRLEPGAVIEPIRGE